MAQKQNTASQQQQAKWNEMVGNVLSEYQSRIPKDQLPKVEKMLAYEGHTRRWLGEAGIISKDHCERVLKNLLWLSMNGNPNETLGIADVLDRFSFQSQGAHCIYTLSQVSEDMQKTGLTQFGSQDLERYLAYNNGSSEQNDYRHICTSIGKNGEYETKRSNTAIDWLNAGSIKQAEILMQADKIQEMASTYSLSYDQKKAISDDLVRSLPHIVKSVDDNLKEASDELTRLAKQLPSAKNHDEFYATMRQIQAKASEYDGIQAGLEQGFINQKNAKPAPGGTVALAGVATAPALSLCYTAETALVFPNQTAGQIFTQGLSSTWDDVLSKASSISIPAATTLTRVLGIAGMLVMLTPMASNDVIRYSIPKASTAVGNAAQSTSKYILDGSQAIQQEIANLQRMLDSQIAQVKQSMEISTSITKTLVQPIPYPIVQVPPISTETVKDLSRLLPIPLTGARTESLDQPYMAKGKNKKGSKPTTSTESETEGDQQTPSTENKSNTPDKDPTRWSKIKDWIKKHPTLSVVAGIATIGIWIQPVTYLIGLWGRPTVKSVKDAFTDEKKVENKNIIQIKVVENVKKTVNGVETIVPREVGGDKVSVWKNEQGKYATNQYLMASLKPQDSKLQDKYGTEAKGKLTIDGLYRLAAVTGDPDRVKIPLKTDKHANLEIVAGDLAALGPGTYKIFEKGYHSGGFEIVEVQNPNTPVPAPQGGEKKEEQAQETKVETVSADWGGYWNTLPSSVTADGRLNYGTANATTVFKELRLKHSDLADMTDAEVASKIWVNWGTPQAKLVKQYREDWIKLVNELGVKENE